jgi:hypothetical protein
MKFKYAEQDLAIYGLNMTDDIAQQNNVFLKNMMRFRKL